MPLRGFLIIIAQSLTTIYRSVEWSFTFKRFLGSYMLGLKLQILSLHVLNPQGVSSPDVFPWNYLIVCIAFLCFFGHMSS